jgi:hypothetical protein
MTNTQSLRWQIASVPKDKNYDVVWCNCGKESAVAKKDHVVDFTCSDCYSRK